MQKLNNGVGEDFFNDDVNGSKSFSDISDAEVYKYINNKKEARYKRIIWEVMNMDYLKGKKQKPASEAKKVVPTKVVAKPSSQMVTEKKFSSKINYDMLKKQNYDEDEVREMTNREVADSCRGCLRDTQLINEKSKPEAYGSGDNNDDEFEHENRVSEEADAIQDYCGITDYGISFDGFGYEDECDYGEY